MNNLSLEMVQGKLLAFLPKLLSALLIFVVGWVAIRFAINLLRKFLKRTRIDPTLHAFILSVTRIGMVVLLSITALDAVGVPTTSLVTSLGAVGLALSLAVKDSLSNLAGGVVVLLLKPFALGDYIQCDGLEGTVAEIGIVHTLLKTVDNKRIYVPNGDIAKAKVTNFTAEPLRRLDLVFSIGYEDDFERAKQVIRKVAQASPMTIEDPAPVVRVTEHGASSINIICRLWVENQSFYDLRFYMLEEVKRAFDKSGISIPYNQLDVRLHTEK